MLMPVQQNSFTHLRVLLVLTDLGIWPKTTSVVVDGRKCPSLGGPLGKTLSVCLWERLLIRKARDLSVSDLVNLSE